MSAEPIDQPKATADEPDFRKAAFNALLTAQASIMLAIFAATFTYYLNMGDSTIEKIFRCKTWVFLLLSLLGSFLFASIQVAIMKAQKYLFIERYKSDIPPTWHIYDRRVWKFCFKEPNSSIPTDNAIHIVTSLCVISILINWIFFALITFSYFGFF